MANSSVQNIQNVGSYYLHLNVTIDPVLYKPKKASVYSECLHKQSLTEWYTSKNYSSSKIWAEVAVLKPPEFEWDPHIPELLTGLVKKERRRKEPCHQQQITLYTTPKLQVSFLHHYLQDENG